MLTTSVTLYYVHDPMCSWCWAYQPVLAQLRADLPAEVSWKNLLGGLAADNDLPMSQQTCQMVQSHWRQIQASVGTEFNFDFWVNCEPRRDTYKACRAVIAASLQGAEDDMIVSIQRGYYLRAMNPSEPATLFSLAVELGLDRVRFEQDLRSAQTDAELHRQLALRDQLEVNRFPSLVLVHKGKHSIIRHDYQSAEVSLIEIQRHLAIGTNA